MRHLLVAPHLHGRRPCVLDQLLQLLQLSLLLRDEVSHRSSSRSALTSLFRSRRRSLRDCRDNGE
eukprot:2420786-Prymnesium_polylepis.1